MNAGILALIALVILAGGLVLGIASMFLLPIVGIVAAAAFVIWFVGREARDKPPIK